MEGKETILKPIKKENRTDLSSAKAFAFDFSYWSFDGYKTEAEGYLSPLEDSNYCDQKRL